MQVMQLSKGSQTPMENSPASLVRSYQLVRWMRHRDNSNIITYQDTIPLHVVANLSLPSKAKSQDLIIRWYRNIDPRFSVWVLFRKEPAGWYCVRHHGCMGVNGNKPACVEEECEARYRGHIDGAEASRRRYTSIKVTLGGKAAIWKKRRRSRSVPYLKALMIFGQL